MKKRYIIEVLVIGQLLLWSFFAPAVFSAQGDSIQSRHSIKVDIPIKLEKANVVFNMDHLAFSCRKVASRFNLRWECIDGV